MTDYVVEADALSKRYHLGSGVQRYGRLSESIASLAKTGRSHSRSVERDFWALRDVSFGISRGEVFGIVGRNGAGKSTLLKILSRVTEPSSGSARVVGRVGSLLEVGTGFHPELSGKENIFLNGALLGMTRSEIRRNFDRIVDFAEVSQFLETPVKRYSSGMYMRLAFSVAAHLEPEILIVDEVLAVGDVGFQRKCLGKMSEVSSDGRTVIFVSHNMAGIRSLCGRAILLEGGRVVLNGSPEAVIGQYIQSIRSNLGPTVGRRNWSGDARPGLAGRVRLTEAFLAGEDGTVTGTVRPDEQVILTLAYDVEEPIRGGRLNALVLTKEGEVVLLSSDHDRRPAVQIPGHYEETCTIPADLLNTREYVIAVSFDIPGVEVLIPRTEVLQLNVVGASNRGSIFPEEWPGFVAPRLEWSGAFLSGAREQ